MNRLVAGLGLLLLSCGSASSETLLCGSGPCPRQVEIASTADDRVYGLLLGAPEAGCRRVRYRVENSGGDLLGKTPVLLAGELAVVRIGTGFAPGQHLLTVTAEGCGNGPAQARRVILRKTSPDHGWRAGLAGAATVPFR